MALALADLIAFSCMLMANLPIKEAISLYNKGDRSGEPSHTHLQICVVTRSPCSEWAINGVLHHSGEDWEGSSAVGADNHS